MTPARKPEKDGAKAEATVATGQAKTPPRIRPAKAVSPSKDVSSTAGSTTPTPSLAEVRIAALEKELAKAQKRADARGKEADLLRKRVQELEPEVRRLEKELEKKRQREASRSPRGGRQPGPGSRTTSTSREEDEVALRGRLAAAENRAKVLQLRCDRIELEHCCRETSTGAEEKHVDEDITREAKNADERRRFQDKDKTAKQIKQQLEVAERRVKNSFYINEAHESMAAEATAREREAHARAAELGRKLSRALEKLESIERKDMILSLGASCVQDEESIYLSEREQRAHQMDPDLYLPINTAKRRQLARSEQRLRRLRQRHESQSAALSQAQTIERLHSDLRRAAACGDIPETTKLLKSGVSVNAPDQSGLSAFMYACGQANTDVIRVMLDAGGDVLDGDGTITGLIIAARKGGTDVIQMLLDAGADVCARDSAGGTALHAATLRGHVGVARMLLEAGSDCNATDQGANTPLHMLATSTSDGGNGGTGVELVPLLCEWGASPDIQNSKGLTPLFAALDAKNRRLVLAYREFFGQDEVLATDSATNASENVPEKPRPGRIPPDVKTKRAADETAGSLTPNQYTVVVSAPVAGRTGGNNADKIDEYAPSTAELLEETKYSHALGEGSATADIGGVLEAQDGGIKAKEERMVPIETGATAVNHDIDVEACG